MLKNLYSKIEPGPKKEKLDFRDEIRVKDLISKCEDQRHIRSTESFDLYKRRAFSARPNSKQTNFNKNARTFSTQDQANNSKPRKIQSSRNYSRLKTPLEPTCETERKSPENKYIPKGKLSKKRR